MLGVLDDQTQIIRHRRFKNRIIVPLRFRQFAVAKLTVAALFLFGKKICAKDNTFIFKMILNDGAYHTIILKRRKKKNGCRSEERLKRNEKEYSNAWQETR